MAIRKWFDFLKEVFSEWREDNASRLAAALAFYSIYALAPLLLITFVLVGLVTNQNSIQGKVYTQIQDAIGQNGANLLQNAVESVNSSHAGTLASILGVLTMVYAATSLFRHLHDSLNAVWEVQADQSGGIMHMVKTWVMSLVFIPLVGLLLLLSLLVDTALGTMLNVFTNVMPSAGYTYAAQALSLVLSFLIVTVLFALLFKWLPDVEIAWNDVWVGAAVTSLLFTIGRFAISIYLSQSGTSSTYGAAGALIVVLLWVYYSSQLFFLGAEFTQVYARRHGTWIRPNDQARQMLPEERAQQGMAENTA